MPRWPAPDGRAAASRWRALLAAAALFSGVVVGATGPRESEAANGAVVGSIGITVDDMDRSLAFYTTVLPFEKVSDERIVDPALDALTGAAGPRRVVRLRLGGERIEVTDYLEPGGHSIPADSRSQDRWFQHVAIIVSDMARAYAHLRAHEVTGVSRSPQRLPDWNPNAGGITAFYFLDPDRHVLEILSFPRDKGDPRWHRSTPLFLGIDHTAIVVADTERSLTFYRDRLGLAVAGESENHGPEQARLNDVEHAHLRITAVRGPTGPGVEFLEYLSPTDGRSFPAGARANDLVHWETTVVLPAVRRVAARLREADVLFISPGLIRLTRALAAVVRDPDGHAVRILEKTE